MTAVSPFPYHQLPSAQATEAGLPALFAHALQCLEPWLEALQRGLSLAPLALHALSQDHAASAFLPTHWPWRISFAPRIGEPPLWLALDAAAVDLLLSRFERGSPLLESETARLDMLAMLAFEQVDAAAQPPARVLPLALHGEAARGRVALGLPKATEERWRAQLPEPLLFGRLHRFLHWSIELGSVQLPRTRLAALRPGALCMPEQPWSFSDHPLRLEPCWLRANAASHRVSACLSARDERWFVACAQSYGPTQTATLMNHGPSSAAPISLHQAIAQTPLQLRFVLARKRFDAAQLAQLSQGDVIDLGVPLGAPLRVELGEHLLGLGELVEVGGQLGVRILSLAEPDHGS